MKRERAWLQLFVDGEARSDIELILDGRADFKAEGAAVSVRVLFNGFDDQDVAATFTQAAVFSAALCHPKSRIQL